MNLDRIYWKVDSLNLLGVVVGVGIHALMGGWMDG